MTVEESQSEEFRFEYRTMVGTNRADVTNHEELWPAGRGEWIDEKSEADEPPKADDPGDATPVILDWFGKKSENRWNPRPPTAHRRRPIVKRPS
jgi:hypothetical protein